MKKLMITLIVLAVIGGSVFGYYKYGRAEEETKFSWLTVTRGDVIESVGATGTLQAVNTVLVGSQVSGNIKALYADFNSIVHKGQVVAELDPSLFQTQIEQAKANLIRSQTDRDRLKVALDDAKNKMTRTQRLFDRKLVTQQDLETADVNVRSADASLKSAEAAIVQAQASLNQNQVSLDNTIIKAPIDGIIINRSVDVGQTVAASMNAPTIFIIAADLTKMQVLAKVDESDVGRIRPLQVVRFRVDAFPGEEFYGSVSQVRLNPTTVQNVVTYDSVIDVPNANLKLKPGMTANVTIEIAKRTDVVRIPNAALRYRPAKDIFETLNLPVPPEVANAGRGGGRGTGTGATGATGTTGTQGGTRGNAPTGAAPQAANAPATTGAPQGQPAQGRQAAAPGQTGQGGGRQRAEGQQGFGAPGGGRGGGRQSMQERMANMTPEQREAFLARMKERGIDPNNPGAGGGRGGGRGGAAGAANASPQSTTGLAGLAAAKPTAQTIDQLFGPLPVTSTMGRVWIGLPGTKEAAAKLNSVRVRVGISDGTWTELISDEIKEGQELVTNILTPAMAAAAANRGTTAQNQNQQGRGQQQQQNPFQAGGGGGRGPGGPGR